MTARGIVCIQGMIRGKPPACLYCVYCVCVRACVSLCLYVWRDWAEAQAVGRKDAFVTATKTHDGGTTVRCYSIDCVAACCQLSDSSQQHSEKFPRCIRHPFPPLLLLPLTLLLVLLLTLLLTLLLSF